MSNLADPPVKDLEATAAPSGPGGAGPPQTSERRRRWWWIAAGAAIVVAGLVIILSGGGDTSPRARAGGAQSGMPMMGGSGSRAAIQTVSVELGEMYVKPNMTTVPAGDVKFVARNVGMVEHELMVERMPIQLDGPGRPTEDAAMGMIEDMGPMHGGQMTVRMKPGKYELFCNVPGHYAAGQRTAFTVTGG